MASEKEKIVAEQPIEPSPRERAGENIPAAKPETPEKTKERVLARPEKLKEAVKPREKSRVSSVPLASPVPDWQRQRMTAIDNILADGLNEIFLKMNPDQQQEFKKKGEVTTAKINELLNKTKVKIRKIIELIKNWLKLIPGVNVFFLEQEAKIKADKILRIKDKF